GFPAFVDRADEVSDEGDMIRFHRLPDQLHARLLGCPVTLPVVAIDACRHQILPGVLAESRFRDEVVDREGSIRARAVLTSMPVTAKDVLPREDNFLVGDVDVDT